MNYRNFTFTSKYFIITHTKSEYHKTPSGGRWSTSPVSINQATVTAEFYENFVQSIPFFNGFFGGSCRADLSYTPAGYVPTRITTINPDASVKYIDTFTFKYNGR